MNTTDEITAPVTEPVLTAGCPFCGAYAAVTLAAQVRGSEHGLRQCCGCSLEYLSPLPSWEQICAIYDSSYYKAWGMEAGETDEVAAMKKATFGLRMREIAKHIKGGRVLDVGTASGFFLSVAQEFGFEPYGVELSEYSATLAQKKFGRDRIWNGTLDTAPFEPGSFNVIAMSDLIEHVPDPVNTLARARNLLTPGGVLMIMTPDTSSLTRRLMGTAWTHYKLEHLTYWNPSVIRRAAEQTGYSVLSIRRARKVMTLAYLDSQFKAYPNPLFTPLVGGMSRVLGSLRNSCFRISMGEMVALLRREGE
jgi:2-polyprenyl-3-methyl-5-hydroxy-6-metoxy-1,4-benzoquinol methylase